MKIQILESSSGEFDSLTQEQFAARLSALLTEHMPPEIAKALSALPRSQRAGCGHHPHDPLSKAKAPGRGGEIRLVDDLSQLLVKGYDSTMSRMVKHIEAEALKAAGEGAAEGSGGGA